MNGKRAKELRRRAESMTVGKPNVKYREHRLPRLFKEIYRTRVIPGTQVTLVSCTRAVYQQLKKIYLRSIRQ